MPPNESDHERQSLIQKIESTANFSEQEAQRMLRKANDRLLEINKQKQTGQTKTG